MEKQLIQQQYSLGGFRSPLVDYIREHQLIDRLAELQQLVPKVSEQLYQEEVKK
jgi:citrate lyase alpha subunit